MATKKPNPLKQKPTKGYLFAFDLSMTSPALTVFNLDDRKCVLITSVQPNEKLSHGERLLIIAKWIKEVMQDYKPDVIAIERGFSRFNTSTQVTFRVHGLVNYIFWNLPQIYYPPKSIKEAILDGGATKDAIRNRIEQEYPDLPYTGKDKDNDESDSVAVGLTYLIKECGMEWHKLEKPKKTKKKVRKNDAGSEGT